MKKQPVYLSISDVPSRVLALTGVSINRATAYNWTRKGRITLDGNRLKLMTVDRCGRRWSKEEWLVEFLRRIG